MNGPFRTRICPTWLFHTDLMPQNCINAPTTNNCGSPQYNSKFSISNISNCMVQIMMHSLVYACNDVIDLHNSPKGYKCLGYLLINKIKNDKQSWVAVYSDSNLIGFSYSLEALLYIKCRAASLYMFSFKYWLVHV